MTGVDSWWGEYEVDAANTTSQRDIAINVTKKKSVDTKNIVSRDISDVDENKTLPLLHIKAGEGGEDETTMYDILSDPPPMRSK